jgi:protein gp37
MSGGGAAFFLQTVGGTRKDLTGRELHGRTYDEMPVPRPQTRPALQLAVV